MNLKRHLLDPTQRNSCAVRLRVGSLLALALVATLPGITDARRRPVEGAVLSESRQERPGLSGEILFSSDREGPMRLFILDLATRNQRRVGTPGPWFDENPSWSHDGRRIVFSSTRGGGNNLDIWLMDADGSNLTRVTDHPSLDQDPVFAHDDRSVFFASERDGRSEIYRVWLGDRRVDRITRGIDRAIMPAVSPDGRYLAFAAQTIMNFQVHLFDLSAGTAQQITSGGGACRPAFAPGSTEVAFVRIAREPSRLETVRESGTRVVVEDRKLWSYYPDYSPDGRHLVFSVSPEHHEGEDWDLALTDLTVPDRFVRLTTGPGNDRVPVWRPALR